MNRVLVLRVSFVVCVGLSVCSTLLAAYELNALTLTLAVVCALISFLHFRYDGSAREVTRVSTERHNKLPGAVAHQTHAEKYR